MPPRQRLDSADAAFIGRILSTRAAERPGPGGVSELVHVFAVDSVVKGELGRRVEVTSPAGSASCGFSLDAQEASGILLRRDTQRDLWIGGLCGQMVVGELIEAAESTPERIVNWGGIVVGSAILLVAALLIWRRLQARRRLLARR